MREAMGCDVVRTFPRGKCKMQAVSRQTGTPLLGHASRFRRFEFDEIKKQETDGAELERRVDCFVCRRMKSAGQIVWCLSLSGRLDRGRFRGFQTGWHDSANAKPPKDQGSRTKKSRTKKRTPKKHEPSAGADRCLEGLWVSFAAAMRVRKARCTLLLLAVCVAKGKLGPNKYWLLAAFAVLRFALSARCDARVCWRRRLLDGWIRPTRPNRRPAFVPKFCEFACASLWPKSPRLRGSVAIRSASK